MKVEFLKKKKIPELSFKGDTWSLFSLSSSTSEADTRGWNWVMCNMWLWRGNTERERPLKCQIPPLNFTSIAVNLKCGAGTATRTVRVWRNSERYPDLYTVTRPRGSQKNKLYLQKKKKKKRLLFVFLSHRLASSKHQKHPRLTNTEISNKKSVFLGHRSIRSVLQNNNNNNICLFFTIKTLCPKGV